MGLVTLQEVKDEIGIDLADFSFDKFLNRKIESVSDIVEKYCNRTFKKSDETEEFTYPKGIVLLSKLPIIGVASFKVDDVVSSEYYLDKEEGILLYKAANDEPRKWDTTRYKEKISISYSAGFDPVPDSIKDVVLSLVRGEYFNREGDPTKDLKFESSPGSVSTSFFDAARIHPMLGRYVGILDEYRMESGMII